MPSIVITVPPCPTEHLSLLAGRELRIAFKDGETQVLSLEASSSEVTIEAINGDKAHVEVVNTIPGQKLEQAMLEFTVGDEVGSPNGLSVKVKQTPEPNPVSPVEATPAEPVISV